MTFSVIIPAKNEAEYLPVLLSSINNQTLQPDEVIVADAHSVDKTKEISEKFGAKVVDGGRPSTGRNNGAKNAKSELIYFLDADVELLDKNFFQKSILSFKNQKLDVATADVLPKDGNVFDVITHKVYNRYVRIMYRRLPHTPGFCILIKKELHDAIGGFDESISFCEDHEYAGRAAKKGKFGFLENVEIPVSTRRMNKDGRINIVLKYLLAEMHLMFVGPIKDGKFKYNFDHLENKILIKEVKKNKL